LSAAGFAVETLAAGLASIGRIRRLAVVPAASCAGHHAHQYAPFFYATLARFVAWRNMPIIFTEHGRDYPDYRRAKRVLANRWILGRRDRVIGVGQCVRRALVEYEGLPPDRIDVIYNGIDIEAHTSHAGERLAARRGLGLADDHMAIIQVARLNHLKDHPTAIRLLHLSHASRIRLLVGRRRRTGKIHRSSPN
jgi:glycosyltransferase involved in cell wall biosynthesis